MADKSRAPRPSTARNGQGPASALGRKQPPEIKSTVGDGKKLVAKPGRTNLLPMKPSAGPKMATTAPGPMKARSLPVPTKKPGHDMDAMYDTYLINFLKGSLAKESERNQEDAFTNKSVNKTLEMIASSNQVVKIYVNKILIHIINQLKNLKSITSAFENLLDFAGEEALLEIQSILTKRFEKVTVEGASIDDGPIFGEIELDTVLNKVKTHLSRNFDTTTVSGFALSFASSLKKVNAMLSAADNVNKSLEEQNKHILESFHLEICEKGWQAFNKKEEGVEDDVNGNGGGGDFGDGMPAGHPDNPNPLEGAVGHVVDELGDLNLMKSSRNEFDSSDGE